MNKFFVTLLALCDRVNKAMKNFLFAITGFEVEINADYGKKKEDYESTQLIQDERTD